MSKAKGKEFEGEIGQSLRAMKKTLPLDYRNSNTPSPMNDHQVWVNGFGFLLEEKECHADSLTFRAITDEERKNFNSLAGAKTPGWVIVKWISGNKSRCFACTWEQWLALEKQYGFNHEAARNPAGSGSFPLVPDSARPACFIELERVQRRDFMGHSLGKHWDLTPLFAGALC